MKKFKPVALFLLAFFVARIISLIAFKEKNTTQSMPKALLVATPKFHFNSFVDCNMAEAWIGDTFRIFPGKYGEDPLWGYAHVRA